MAISPVLRDSTGSMLLWPMTWSLALRLGFALASAGLPLLAQTTLAIPLFAKTTAPLDVTRLSVGSLVVAQVLQPWKGPDCSLPAGSVVQGHVVAMERHTKTSPLSRVEVAFSSADCNRRPSSPIALQIVALAAPLDVPAGQSGVTEAPPLADVPGLAIGAPGTKSGALRSVSSASDLNNYAAQPLQAGLPASARRGDVIHLPNITLGVDPGPNGGSVIADKHRDVRLERGTVLLLAPDGRTVPTAKQADLLQRSPLAATVGVSPPAVRAGSESFDQSEICSDHCSQARPSEIGGVANARLLSLRNLRYLPHDKQLRTDFNRETTLTYLDADTLLCTFDPHFLREHDTHAEDGARTIRAVLIDSHTLAIKRIVEWKTRGNAAYLWRAGRGHVLVHIGHELQLLGSSLQPLHSLRVHGRIAFVEASPSGDRIVVGTVRERYSEEVRDRLAQDLAEEPEEPVEVKVLDRSLNLIAETERTTRSPAPMLTDDGELRMSKQGTDHWKLSVYEWSRRERVVSSLKSACRPQLSIPDAGMIFVVGCSTTGGHWYRMLRPDGRAVMKADSPSDEVMQTSDEASANAFAVRLVHANRAMSDGKMFSRDDLVREDVGVYRNSDGHSIAVIRTKDFAIGRDTYALSPGGDALVVAGSRELQFYSLVASP